MMAASATPLFVADKATLKASLRLGGLVDTDAADDILNDAMLRARTLMIRVLGDGPVATLTALPSTDSPTTREEVQKVEAQQLEVVLTKRFLLPELHRPRSWTIQARCWTPTSAKLPSPCQSAGACQARHGA